MRCRTGNWPAVLVVVVLTAANAAAADDDIRLTGCLVRGEDGDGYLVTNVPGEAAWQRTADATVVPGPVGTSGTISSILYWLVKRDGVDDHVGHYIEIDGKFQGDLTEGQIKVTPKEQWTEVEIESGGTSMKAQVPRSVLFIPGDGDRTLDVLVRRVVPQRIRMLATACGS
jgi:hypothetical protein